MTIGAGQARNVNADGQGTRGLRGSSRESRVRIWSYTPRSMYVFFTIALTMAMLCWHAWFGGFGSGGEDASAATHSPTAPASGTRGLEPAIEPLGLAARPGTALIASIRAGDVEGVRRMLSDGASANAVTEDGRSVLAFAIAHQNREIVDLLLDADASLETHPGGEPVLVTAIQTGDESLAMELLRRGAPTHSRDSESPLSAAIVASDAALVAALIDSGVDVNARDGSGDPPIVAAVITGQVEMLDLLLLAGASVDRPQPGRQSLLEIAEEVGAADVVDRLRMAGATEGP